MHRALNEPPVTVAKLSPAPYVFKRFQLSAFLMAWPRGKLRRFRAKCRRTRLIRMLGGCCRKCGFANPVALDFHHLDPLRKSFQMSGAQISNRSWTAVFREALKCILLCANCHRVEHHRLYIKGRKGRGTARESGLPTADKQ